MRFYLPALLLVLALAPPLSFSDSKAPPAPEMSKRTRMDLIKAFTAELVYIRTSFPMGNKGLRLKDGQLSPHGEDLEKALALAGPSVKAGDQAMITKIDIKGDHIRFEINGGPIKKKKWYQHISVGMGNAETPIAPDDPRANPRGTFVNLEFDHYIPEMDPQQLKAFLRPVFDFDSKSGVEAYLETVPPKVKEAIQKHNVLVGMNREMVTYAMGRPPKKTREKGDDGVEYEEWIYGDPPKDVDFVRFVGDEVVRVETMKVDGQKMVRTEKEVDLGTQPTLAKGPDEPVRPANAPTLRRPGEAADPNPRTDPGADPHGPARTSPSPDPSGGSIPHYLALTRP
jgi:hypothetical protein